MIELLPLVATYLYPLPASRVQAYYAHDLRNDERLARSLSRRQLPRRGDDRRIAQSPAEHASLHDHPSQPKQGASGIQSRSAVQRLRRHLLHALVIHRRNCKDTSVKHSQESGVSAAMKPLLFIRYCQQEALYFGGMDAELLQKNLTC